MRRDLFELPVVCFCNIWYINANGNHTIAVKLLYKNYFEGYKLMEDRQSKYFELIICSGVNIQKGQLLVIRAQVENAPQVRALAKEAYKAGAKKVIVRWDDDELERLTFMNGDDAIFDVCDSWLKTMMDQASQEGAAFLTLVSSDPESLKGVDTDRVIRSRVAFNTALKAHRNRLMSNECRWCIAAVPSKAWAKRVFPLAKSGKKAVEKLWEAILAASRVDEDGDAIANWEAHTSLLKKRGDKMNRYNFSALHLQSKNGTDLTVGLAPGHIWEGGVEVDTKGTVFSANIPTEELFTCPDRGRVDGVVKSTKPLIYQGNLIDNFTIWFEKGKAVRVEAEKGQDLLEKIIAVDEGAAYLGEIALVPYHSPISQSGVLFYNTLFDENAACHLAFGEAYPGTVKGALGKSDKERIKMGVNKSGVHEDFMIGASDMTITGIKQDGKKVKVFKDGDFVF